MYKLRTSEYEKYRYLFKELEFNIVIDSVIDLNTHGEIYVSDLENPDLALLWDLMGEVIIVGEPNNKCLEKFKTLINDEIKPRLQNHYVPAIDIYYSKKLEKELKKTFLDEDIEHVTKNFYEFKRFKSSTYTKSSIFFALLPIDKNLLERTDLINLEYIKGWINSFWFSEKDFVSKGLGFALIVDNKIVSWCLSVFVSKNKFEFGLETINEFRKNGYGKTTATECIRHCLAKNITPYWQCYKSNIASHKVSESIGFQKKFEFDVINLRVD